MSSKYLISYFFFLLFFISSVIVSSVFVSTVQGNVLILLTCIPLLVVYSIENNHKINVIKLPFLAVTTIISIYLIGSILYLGTGDAIIRPVAYAVIAFTCIFVIPDSIKLDYGLFTFANFSAFLILIGLIPFVVGPVSILGAEISTNPYLAREYYFFGDRIQTEAMTSVFTNQNTLGSFAFVGSISALHFLIRKRSVTTGLLFSINILGLYLSHNRSAALALLIAISVIASYVIKIRCIPKVISLATLPTILIVTGIGSGLIPYLTTVHDFLGPRHILWVATVDSVIQSPILGSAPIVSEEAIAPFVSDDRYVGMTPHNAYLSLFTTTGIIGGMAYILLFGYALMRQSISLKKVPIAVVAMAIGIAWIQLFEAILLFGLTSASVIFAISIGYVYRFSSLSLNPDRS